MTMSPAVREASRDFMGTAEGLPRHFFSLSDEMMEILDLLEFYQATGSPEDAEYESELEQRLAEVAAALAQKVERCAFTVQDFLRLAEARKAEADRLRNQAKRLESVAERLKRALQDHMHSVGTDRMVTTRYTVRLQANPSHVEVLDAALVPSKFQRTKIIIEVDKAAIRDYWKRTGEIPPGVDIVRGESVRIS